MSVIDIIRGPATSPFSQQPKYQGNKNSFGLATGPPLQQQQAPTQQPCNHSQQTTTQDSSGGTAQSTTTKAKSALPREFQRLTAEPMGLSNADHEHT